MRHTARPFRVGLFMFILLVSLSTNSLAVTLSSGAPASITVPASSTTGSYTVRWGASATAGVTYSLQEATNSTFTTGVRTAYTGTALTASITGRTKGNTYYYRVKATKMGYTVSAWRTGAIGCKVGTPTCATPSSITVPATSTTGSYTVRWGASATTGVTYSLQEATNSTFTAGLRTAYTGTVLTASITGRATGKTYYYRVQATKTGYTASAWRTGANGSAVGSSTSTCGTPAGLTVPASSTTGSYSVSWGASATAGVTYSLQEATDPAFTTGLRTSYTGALLTASITGRPAGTYYYRVQATKTGCTASSWRSCASGCVVTTTCANPSSLTVPASSTADSYTVSWGASSTSGVTYELQEAIDPAFTTGLRTAYTGMALSTSITGCTIGVTYYYQVMATKTGCTSSAWVAATNGCAVGSSGNDGWVVSKIETVSGSTSTVSYYYFDSHGWFTRIETDSTSNGATSHYTSIYTRDSQGRTIEISQTSIYGTTTTYFDYDEHGSVVRTYDGSHNLLYSYTYDYDEYWNVTNCYDGSHNLLYSYTYDSGGNITNYKGYSTWNGKTTLISDMYRYYDSTGRLLSETIDLYDVNGQYVKSVVSTCGYDSNGYLSTIIARENGSITATTTYTWTKL